VIRFAVHPDMMRHAVRPPSVRSLALAAIASVAGASGLAGQIRGSEAAVVAQTVDGTTITVEYSRPVARGRALFGGLVPWNGLWTGANWATTLDVNRTIRLNGTDVPAAKYSVWITPRENAPWTVSLDRNARLFHNQKPDSTAEQIHLVATPEAAPHVEMLTWTFPAVAGDAAELRMQWGTTALPLRIVVQPTKPVALDPEDVRLYVGAYDMTMLPGTRWPGTGRLEVFEEGGLLRGRLPFPIHPDDELSFDLIPAGEHRFSPGLYRDGTLFNIEMGGTFEFDVKGGAATHVRLRALQGTVLGEGPRIEGK
jgi:hypothetical protein